MIDTTLVARVVEESLQESDLFLVEIKLSASNAIEVIVDSDTIVNIDRCVELSKKIEAALDRDAEDFELTVASAGVGQPLQLLRQYLKIVGRQVDVVLKEGTKLEGVLMAATDHSITLQTTEKVAVEGKKRKETQQVTQELELDTIKSTKEHLSFK